MSESKKINNNTIIKVIGVGGGGGNAVEHMVREKIEGVEFYAVNTDAQSLKNIEVKNTIQIGNNITKGLGAGSNPEIGKNSAEENRESLKSALEGSDMIFIASGMGGGTGTGAAPIIAEIAKNLGILTVAVITKPFSFEGKKRMDFAEQGILNLSQNVDSLITIPNDKLLKVLNKGISLLDAFAAVNNILKDSVQGISELITKPGLINVDFSDIRSIMSEMGYAIIGTGIASGDNRAEEASETAIFSPLLEDVDLSGAKGILVNITAGCDLRLDEFETVGNTIKNFTSDDAIVVIGTSLDIAMNDKLRVTVVATGITIINELSHDKKKTKCSFVEKSFSNNSHQHIHKNYKQINEFLKNKITKKKSIYQMNKFNHLDIPTFLRNKK